MITYSLTKKQHSQISNCWPWQSDGNNNKTTQKKMRYSTWSIVFCCHTWRVHT